MSDDAGRELARIQKWNLVVLAVAIGWAARYGARAAESVALGGAIGAVNFWLTAQVIRRTFVAGPAAPGGGALVSLKFFGLFAAVGALLWFLRPDGLGFGAGFCTVLIAVVLLAIVDLVRQKDEATTEGSDANDDAGTPDDDAGTRH